MTGYRDDGWRFGVRLNIPGKVLKGYMHHKGHTVRSLATAVERVTKKKCPHASIGHLLVDRRKGISDDKARAIEKILDVPPGSFFVAEVSRVARDARGRVIA